MPFVGSDNFDIVSASNINTPDYWNGVYREEWESGAVQGGNYHRDYGPIHDAVIGLISAGCRVLDIACGAGLLCRKIKAQVPSAQVTGVDFSEYTIRRNQERDRELGIAYRCLDIRTSLNAVKEQFDVVTMCEIVEHLEDPDSVVAAAMDHLADGGRFILTCPHENEIPDVEHVRVWGHDELFHLLSRYSRTVSFTHFPPPYFHIWMLAYLTKNPAAAPMKDLR